MKQNGFTLVELAIVLMIIGLLIGGVLRGQELMQNARVNSTIEQVKAYTGAFTTFVDAYNNYPGDMPTATTRIPGCASPCTDGNGNSIIDSGGSPAIGHINADLAGENTQFWNHLALAHMITGVVPNSTTTGWGTSHPSSKFSGGFFVRYINVTTVVSNVMSSQVFQMRSSIDGTPNNCGPTNFCALSGKYASQIDRKMDDGLANDGDVRSISAALTNGCGPPNIGTNGPNGYDETAENKNCEIYFLFK